MKRRNVIRSASLAAAGIVGVAGCAAPDGGEDGPTVEETPEDGDTPMETGTTAPGTQTETPGTEAETGTEPAGTTTEEGAQTETPTTPDGAGEIATSYRFLGRVEAWMGEEPQEIADQENPTLELTAGERYEVTWENGDGLPHDFTLQDDQGSNLEQSETTAEEGAEITLQFTATPEMTQYICTVHPETMAGDVAVSDG